MLYHGSFYFRFRSNGNKAFRCTYFYVPVFLLLLITQMAAKVGELEDSIQEVYQHSKDNRKEIGRLEGTCVSFFLRSTSSIPSCTMAF